MPALALQSDDNLVHNLAVQQAHSVRQAAIAAATTQAGAHAADLAFYQTVQASTIANNVPFAIAACNVAILSLRALKI